MNFAQKSYQFIIQFLLLLFCSITAFSQSNYYVSPSGLDTDDGSEAHPWKTFQKACNTATPGSNVFFKQGVYNEKVTMNVSGTAGGGYITFQNYGNDIAILDGTGKSGDQLLLIEDKSYIKIIGLELRNNLNQTFGTGIWVMGGGSHIEIRKNTIHDMRRSGGGDCMAISIYGTSNTSLSNIVIDSNVIYDCEPGHSETLTLNGNVDTFWVTNNLVHDVNNIGIDMIGGEGTAPMPSLDVVRNGICRGNTVYHARSLYGGGYAAGIYVDGGVNIILEHNISYSNDVGIEVGCENHGRVSSGMIIRNNLVYNNDKRGIGIGGYDYPTTGKVTTTKVLNNTCFNNDVLGTDEGELTVEYTENCLFKNNIFFSNSRNRLMVTTVGNASGNIFDYNLWYAPGGSGSATIDYNGTVYAGFSAYRSGTGQDSHSLFSNPLFVLSSLPSPDLHLQSGSTAIDAGDPSFVPEGSETDFDGNPRVDGTAVDCGAYEKIQFTATSPILIEPLNDVLLHNPNPVLQWGSSDSGATYHVQLSGDSLFTTLLINDSLLTDTVRQALKTINGIYYWRVRAKINTINSSWSDIWHFTYTSLNRWKLVSLPFNVVNSQTSNLFPGAISSAFGFQQETGYTMHDSLDPGTGYWLKFNGDESTNYAGDSIFADTLNVVEGWNLIGTISLPVPVSSIETNPTNLLVSNFYKFENGYSVSDMILPGEGYWIKTGQAGQIILNGLSTKFLPSLK